MGLKKWLRASWAGAGGKVVKKEAQTKAEEF